MLVLSGCKGSAVMLLELGLGNYGSIFVEDWGLGCTLEGSFSSLGFVSTGPCIAQHEIVLLQSDAPECRTSSLSIAPCSWMHSLPAEVAWVGKSEDQLKSEGLKRVPGVWGARVEHFEWVAFSIEGCEIFAVKEQDLDQRHS